MEFIREAGWGIYPVLAFGLAALAAAVRNLVASERRHVVTVGWLMGLTLLAGGLGTATGLQTSAHYITSVAADERWIFVVGMRESLNNMVASLVIVTLAMLLLLIAHLRGGTPSTAASREGRSVLEPS